MIRCTGHSARQGGLGSLVAQLLLRSFKPAADVAVINRGALRIDRTLETGEAITEKTLSAICYPDNLSLLCEWDEATLDALLQASAARIGSGKYLPVAGVPRDGLNTVNGPVLRVVTIAYVAQEFLKGFAAADTGGELKDVLKNLLRGQSAT